MPGADKDAAAKDGAKKEGEKKKEEEPKDANELKEEAKAAAADAGASTVLENKPKRKETAHEKGATQMSNALTGMGLVQLDET